MAVEEQKETVTSEALNSDRMSVDEVPISQSKAIDPQPECSTSESKQADKDEEEEEDIGEVFVVSNLSLPFIFKARKQ